MNYNIISLFYFSVQNETNSVIKNALSFELPYYSKYLLIAAYLASYNPEKSDKRIFLKGSEKRGRKLKLQLNNKSNLKQTLLGPKDFTMDRLLAIFYAIVECNVSLTANLLLQVKICFYYHFEHITCSQSC